MMDWLLEFVYIGIVLAAGLGVSGLILRGRVVSPVEIFGLSSVTGSGVVGLILVLCSLVGLKPGPLLVLAIGAVAGVAVICALRRRCVTFESCGFGRPGRRVLIAGVVLLVAVATVAMHALMFPLYEWDAFAIWGLKTKVLLHDSLATHPDYFQSLPLSYSHLDYPLLVPALFSGSHALVGNLNEAAAKAVLVLMFSGFAALFYSELQRNAPATEALVLTALLMSVPEWVRWAGSGLADVPLAIFYGSALIFALRWITDFRRSDLAFMLLFLLFAASTKNEGLPIAIITSLCAGAAAFARENRRAATELSVGMVLTGLAYMPWALFSRALPKTHENYAARLNWVEISANAARIDDVFWLFLQEFGNWRHWGVVWVLLIHAVLFGGRRALPGKAVVLWCILLLHLLLYFAVFVVTPWDIADLSTTALNRLFLHLLPVAVLIIAVQGSSAWKTTVPDEDIKKREGV